MKTIGNLLLTLGTIVASLAAANSQRASRWLELAGDTSGEFLYAAVEAGGETLAAGTELDANVVARLQAAGESSVLVRTPPRTSRTVPVEPADAVVGGVLAEAVSSPDGEETFPADTYVDEPFQARLAAAGVAEVPLKVTKKFDFGAWAHKWYFVIGVLLMIAGVLLKRSATNAGPSLVDVEGGPSRPRQTIDDLLAKVQELAERSATLDADDIKASIDPLLEEDVPSFVEAADEVRRVHGAGVFAHVYGAFANGERKLSRAWSAAVDGAVEESRASVALAADYIREAQEALPR